MENHKWAPGSVAPAHRAHARGPLRMPRRGTAAGRTARAACVLALLLGGLGIGAVSSPAFGGTTHPRAPQPVRATHLARGTHHPRPGHFTHRPWMY
jgi:hypothetical protein